MIVGAWAISICHDYHGVAGYQQFVPGERRIGRSPAGCAGPALKLTTNAWVLSCNRLAN